MTDPAPRPAMALALDWAGDLTFKNRDGSPGIELHSNTPGVTSPTQALAYAVMACMGMDLVHVITRGRHDLQALRVAFEGERSNEHPRRFVSMHLHFHISGRVEPHVVQRAIDLSRTQYCSVLNTIRPDVDFQATFEIEDGTK